MDQSQNPDRPDHLTPARDPFTPAPNQGATDMPAASAEGPGAPAPPPPLGPVAWLANNAIYFLLMLALAVWLYREDGVEGLWKGAVVILGLGFVIFIHELGHFVVAKLCDVHVTTFSIGFGPALPGCSFLRGETMYKIGVLPLGGYVSMVGGEGMESDEDEDYPRSLRNKPVGQRMLIMSAGVIMNVLFGCVCFVGVYLAHGRDRLSSSIWQVDAGSPAWKSGVQSDWTIEQIGGIEHPSFEQLKAKVALGGQRPLDVRFKTFNGKEVDLVLVPHREREGLMPVIGIAPAPKLKLWGEAGRRQRPAPVVFGSAAAAARPLDLAPGDRVLRATDPKHQDQLMPLEAPQGGTWVDALSTRLTQLAGKPLVVEVQRKEGKKVETINVPLQGFAFGDRLVGMTAVDEKQQPGTAYNPFQVAPLPPPPADVLSRDLGAFALRRRMKQLLGRPVVVQVQRRKDAPAETPVPPVSLLVPPAYHLTFGLRMKMGPVAGVRDDSPAAKAQLAPGDIIEQVILKHDGKVVAHFGPGEAKNEEGDKQPLDPVRLRFDLAHYVNARQGRRAHQVAGDAGPTKWQVTLKVHPYRAKNGNVLEDRGPMKWEESFRFDAVAPVGLSSPLAIPELGLAYDVENVVEEVKPGSVAAQAEVKTADNKTEKGLHKGDEIVKIRFREPGKKPGAEPRWSESFDVVRSDVHEKDSIHWASCFWDVQPKDSPGLVYGDLHEVELVVKRDGEDQRVTLTAAPDTSWPLADRGLLFQMDIRLEKASGPMQALAWGVERTQSFIQQVFLGVSRLVTGGVSVRTLGGPVEIASQAFSAAESPSAFFLFLGLISVNLAVLNFLPIPLLDGGHMVFLIYEKLRGRPPSENVRAVASYVGLALLLTLMVFVFYQDFERHGWLPWQWLRH